MSAPLVLLVSRSASRTQTYRVALDRLGISCLGISDLKGVSVLTAGTPFSGILLDMPILIKSSVSDKAAIEDTLKALPSAYLNIAPATDAIKLLIATGTRGSAKNLEEFAHLCKAFTPRQVRPNNRYPLHLKALVSSTVSQDPPEKSVTLNVSPEGCFLFSSRGDLLAGHTVIIEFTGIDDHTTIKATVCWLSRWGAEGHVIPGIGVRFDSITDTQKAQIATLLEPFKAQ